MTPRQMAAVIAVGLMVVAAPAAAADPSGPVTDEDQFFLEALQKRGALINFSVQRDHALVVCGELAKGVAPIDAVRSLQSLGAYSFDVAAAITSAGSTAYCPWISWVD